VVEFPGVTVCDEGEAEIEKSAMVAAETTREVVVECVRVPLVPVMVSVEVPTGVVLAVVTVSVEVPLPLIVAGEKLAVAPVGNPLAPKVTVPVNPFSAPTVTV
jgi:hypothetical protein